MKVVFLFPTKEISKTSNPLFSEGKDLTGNMPEMPRTDSMFDHKEKPRPAKKEDTTSMVHGQKHTGHTDKESMEVTRPGTMVPDTPLNVMFHFDSPGQNQP